MKIFFFNFLVLNVQFVNRIFQVLAASRRISSINTLNLEWSRMHESPELAAMVKGRKTTKGKQKIEIKKIEDEDARYISFSKRRNGIYAKASDLATLCGVEIAVVVFSPTGRPHSFGSPSVTSIIDRFLSGDPYRMPNAIAGIYQRKQVS